MILFIYLQFFAMNMLGSAADFTFRFDWVDGDFNYSAPIALNTT